MNPLKYSIGFSLVICLGLSVSFGLAQDKTPPEKIVFEAALGNVTFEHAKHAAREEGKCETCHDSVFPQSRAPLDFKKGMHAPAEAAKTSCAHCHHEGGKSFATKGNCKNCHMK